MATMKKRVLVEIMPEHLVESHKAARNFGTYPRNGAERIIVNEGDVGLYLKDNGYDKVVRVATPHDEADYENYF